MEEACTYSQHFVHMCVPTRVRAYQASCTVSCVQCARWPPTKHLCMTRCVPAEFVSPYGHSSHTCMHVRTYMDMNIRMYVCRYIQTYMYPYVCVLLCTYFMYSEIVVRVYYINKHAFIQMYVLAYICIITTALCYMYVPCVHVCIYGCLVK